VPVLCEGTSRMTRAASDCTSEHGKNYFDSRLMSDMGIFRQPKSGRLLQLFFRGLLSVHSCYGLHARRVAKRPSTPKAPTASLPPLPLRLLPGGANQFPGGNRTR
jgi:hypothetical protein